MDNILKVFIIAVKLNDQDAVRYFLKKVDVNAQDEEGKTALILASDRGYTEIVKLLLEAGANVNLQDSHGNTALMWASSKGHIEVVRLLLESGAKVDLQNKDGATALMWASGDGKKEIAKILLENGANILQESKYKEIALSYAFESSFFADFRALTKTNVEHRDLTSKDKDIARKLILDSSYMKTMEMLLNIHIEKKHTFDEKFKLKLESFATAFNHKEFFELLKKIKTT